MGKKRKMTTGEIDLVRAGFADKINYGKVKVHDGPGSSFAAHIAFARGNPAITLGSDVHYKHDFCDDFSAPGRDRKGFMHELSHVWQYQKLGVVKFMLRYGEDLAKVGGKTSDMYRYEAGKTKFGKAMLEAQATMICDYSEAVWTGDTAQIALLGKNMAGSGLYGL